MQACEIMARERVGVLLVFERQTSLDEYFKTGTLIDAKVTDQLLRNLFFKNSPLHDGAVIIRHGRVAAAGCVLPLSENTHLSSDLGTRHRAGIGMSEASDAVVVIVSEETGTISVAIGGMLKRHLAPQTLEKLLTNELLPEDDGRKKNVVERVRAFLPRRKNRTMKKNKIFLLIISLMAASILWIYVVTVVNPEGNRTITGIPSFSPARMSCGRIRALSSPEGALRPLRRSSTERTPTSTSCFSSRTRSRRSSM